MTPTGAIRYREQIKHRDNLPDDGREERRVYAYERAHVKPMELRQN
jgi:hypothetical protein